MVASSVQAQDIAALDAAQKEHEMKLNAHSVALSMAADEASKKMAAEKEACKNGDSGPCVQAMEETVPAREKVLSNLEGLVDHLDGAIANRLPVIEHFEKTAQ